MILYLQFQRRINIDPLKYKYLELLGPNVTCVSPGAIPFIKIGFTCILNAGTDH